MKTICFLKDCNNFNGDFDCILHYSKIQNDALERIVLHYNAMRSKLEETMNENAKYEEEAKKKCKNQFEAIFGLIKNREGASSPETCSSSPGKQSRKSNSSQKSAKKAPLSGKENSPTKKSKSRSSSRSSKESKESLKDISIDPKPAKEKRTKQTKLPFLTSSAKKQGQHENNEEDEDMTFCEELERNMHNLRTEPRKAKNAKTDSSDVFNFENFDNFPRKRFKESSPVPVEPKEASPQKLLGIKIKQEKENERSFKVLPPPSPELFMSDLSSNNSVIYIEPPEKEVISISDRTYPTRDLMKEIQQEINQARNKKLFEDSIPADIQQNKEPIEERDVYEGECLDCQVFYDNILEKKSLSEANAEINDCPIKCDGWKERCKKLGKYNNPRKKGMVIIKCNSKFARRRKEDVANETAPGIWDLNVEPRKSKPLFSKNNENYETPDL